MPDKMRDRERYRKLSRSLLDLAKIILAGLVTKEWRNATWWKAGQIAADIQDRFKKVAGDKIRWGQFEICVFRTIDDVTSSPP